VDPIKTVHGLLGQRKRWINGSFFAFEKVKKELGAHEEKKGFEFCLNLQIFYLTLMNSLAYFAPALFLFTVHIAMDAFRSDILSSLFTGLIGDANHSQLLDSFVYTMDFIYVMLICSIIYYSLHLTNSNKNFKPYIYAVSTIFGIFAISVFVVLAVDVFRGLIDNAACMYNSI
jgi:cellulose synthase/poly-beta-1,6-N-acetylglucosamine synthase-like glycosyltransferase